jgi:homogentisate phytyltransferase/homogentisate geranylgeranyltransferase
MILMPFLQSLWRFSRPHTIYGTSLSVLGLFALAIPTWDQWGQYLPQLLIALVACLGMNIYIVGLNQLFDYEIDRINKPDLPLAAGRLTHMQALGIILLTGVLGLGLSLWQFPYLFATVCLSGLIGTAYSLPPVRLKRFPVAAALCIYVVRGWIVNLGLYSYFLQISNAPVQLAAPLWILTLFISVFGFVIAVFKDIPDMEGDRRFRIQTFSIRMGPQRIFNGSVLILTACYLLLFGLSFWLLPQANQWILGIGHLGGCGVLWFGRRRIDLQDRQAVTNYYQLIWKLFYLEYLIYPWAFL